MNKQEVIEIMSSKNFKSDYAVVECDIACGGKVCYPNEKIIVRVNGDVPLVKAFSFPIWCVCDSINDFDKGIVFGDVSARENYCNYYVKEFKSVQTMSV